MESSFCGMKDLYKLFQDSRLSSGMKNQIRIMTHHLTSLRFFIFIMKKLNYSSSFAEISVIDATLEKKGFQETGVLALESGDLEDWNNLCSELLQYIQIFKLSMKEDCFKLLDCLSYCKLSSNELHTLMDFTKVCLHNFLFLKGDLIPNNEKVKIKCVKEDMDLLKMVFQFTMVRCKSCEEMEYFKTRIQAWASHAACFYLLNWVEATKKNHNVFPDLLQRLNTALPEVTRTCLAVLLKASKPSSSEEHDETLEVGTLVTRFVDFLLGKSQHHDTQMLRNGMTFLITFLMDPPEDDHRKAILAEAADAVNDVLVISLSLGEIKEGVDEKRNILILDFLGKVKAIEAEVRKLYAPLFLDSSSFNFPSINVLGLFDSVIEKLKGICTRYPLHQIVKIQEELLFLKNFLRASDLEEDCSISKLRNEHNELKDLYARIVNMVYQVERIVGSFLYLRSFVWLHMLSLFNVSAEIKHISVQVQRFGDHHHHRSHGIDSLLDTETNLNHRVLLQTNVQTMGDLVVVGFKDEAKEIIDWLTAGSKKRDILSIIGMPGMGKTTLARKVYNDPSIKNNFTRYAWCTVSQSYNYKRLLLDILKDVTLVDDKFFKKEEGDLAHDLKKCLIGHKYLIVLDDIWDVDAWNELKTSFPDDDKGSRIIFTSRNRNVGLEADPESRPYDLRPLSEEESWELLEKRVFPKGNRCPPNFAEVGKKIARDSKGLALAIVLVAGILKEKLENLDWWKQIGENLDSRITTEGCAHILEQSYKHLPEFLKPCMLYFGSFREDKVIRVHKLIQLWISEGFIREREMEDLEVVAEEYLMNLVARSLVIVTERSSRGGIKGCQIHDLLWVFCLKKAEENNFFKVLRGKDNSQVSCTTLDKHYRVCIQSKDWASFLHWDSSALHSLHFSPTVTFNLFEVRDDWSFSPTFLQVLDLEDVKLLGDFPKNITKLVLLRYIAIQCAAKSIPTKISNLKNLETFRMRRSQRGLSLPRTMWELEKLRHVDVGHCFPPYLRYNCALENIQSFSFPHLTRGERTKIFLRKIPKLRKLKCEFTAAMGEEDGDHQILELDFLSSLKSLNMTCIQRNLGSCPFSFPSNLKKLTLKYFGISWAEVSIITKQLPNLEVLKLLKEAFSGKAWTVADDDFPKLKFLKLQSLNIEKWDAFDESFPCLEQLVLDKCDKLQQIPSAFQDIKTLRMIQVEWCNSRVVASVLEIQKELVDLGNDDLKVFIGRSSDKK